MGGFTIKSTEQLLRERGIEKGGKVQKFIDSECIRLMDKYTPKRTGILIKSASSPLGTVIGSGEIKQVAPYAKNNYYNNAGRGTQGTASGGLRGRLWFKRMVAAHKQQILDGALRLCGGKAEP